MGELKELKELNLDKIDKREEELDVPGLGKIKFGELCLDDWDTVIDVTGMGNKDNPKANLEAAKKLVYLSLKKNYNIKEDDIGSKIPTRILLEMADKISKLNGLQSSFRKPEGTNQESAKPT